MRTEEVFEIVEEVFGGFQLNEIQKIVILETWNGQSYTQIAKAYGYEYGYVKDVGYELWRNFSVILGEKVTKHNFQHIMKRCVRASNGQASNYSGLSKSNLETKEESFSIPRIEGHETRWIGRKCLLLELIQRLQSHCRILSLVGITGVGKSTLAIRLALDSGITQTWPNIRVIRFDGEKNTFEAFAKQLLGEQFPKDPDLYANPQQVIEPLLDYLRSQSCLFILDMVENILTLENRGGHRFQDPVFSSFFDQLIKTEDVPSCFILTSQDQVPVMAEGRYNERSHAVHLKGLDAAESLELFAIWDIMPTSDGETEYLQRIIKIYQGHPLALQTIAGEILELPYCGDISAYWQDYGQEIVAGEQRQNESVNTKHQGSNPIAYYSVSLSDLVKSRIEHSLQRLKASAPLAYLLLCMGSVYRCPVERAAWLLVIEDSPRESQIIAFQTLQRRFLLETDRITGSVTYYLHNLIRSVALQHLSTLDEDNVL